MTVFILFCSFVDGIRIRKGKNGRQIKEMMKETLMYWRSRCSLFEGCKLFLELGSPLKSKRKCILFYFYLKDRKLFTIEFFGWFFGHKKPGSRLWMRILLHQKALFWIQIKLIRSNAFMTRSVVRISILLSENSDSVNLDTDQRRGCEAPTFFHLI
jgi:hypothetical protein